MKTITFAEVIRILEEAPFIYIENVGCVDYTLTDDNNVILSLNSDFATYTEVQYNANHNYSVKISGSQMFLMNTELFEDTITILTHKNLE